MKTTFFTLLIALFIGNQAIGQTLTVDSDNAKVSFNMPIEKVTGTITGLEASIVFNPSDLSSSKIKGSILVENLTTNNKMRDNHLKSGDFFEVKTYPTMSFESSSFKKTDKGYSMTGVVTIKDINKEVTINFTFEDNVFVGKLIIYSNDFGINEQKKREDSKVLVKLNVPVK